MSSPPKEKEAKRKSAAAGIGCGRETKSSGWVYHRIAHTP